MGIEYRLRVLNSVCGFLLDMTPSIIDVYLVTFDSNEYQETAIFVWKKKHTYERRDNLVLILQSYKN